MYKRNLIRVRNVIYLEFVYRAASVGVCEKCNARMAQVFVIEETYAPFCTRDLWFCLQCCPCEESAILPRVIAGILEIYVGL